MEGLARGAAAYAPAPWSAAAQPVPPLIAAAAVAVLAAVNR